jgi:hypothetical protein
LKLVIHEELGLTYLDKVPRDSNDALNDIGVRLIRPCENYNIPSLGLCELVNEVSNKREPNPIGKLADEDMVPNSKSGNHRAGGNFESLDN